MVPKVGLEPTRSKATDFESVVYTNFTTRADAAYYTYTRLMRKPLFRIYQQKKPTATYLADSIKNVHKQNKGK
jgi:hypothetical protein